MSNQRGLVIHFDDARHFSMLSDVELGMLFRALIQYAETGDPQDFDDPAVSMCFSFLSARVDRDKEAYLDRCEKNHKNATKGGRPKKPNGFSKNQMVSEKTEKTLSYFLPVSSSLSSSELCNVVGDDKKTQHTKKRFSPPTVGEVRSYCSERGNAVNAQKFVDYYESQGWKVGRNPMKSWQAAVRTWERTDVGRSKGTSGNPFMDIAREEGICK